MIDKAAYDDLKAELNALMDKAVSADLSAEEEKRIDELEKKIIEISTSEVSGIATALDSLRILNKQGWPSVKAGRLMQGLVEASDNIIALQKSHQVMLDELANLQADVDKLKIEVEALKKAAEVKP